MAAPIDTSELEKLDLTSPNFNPLAALYSPDTKIPCPQARPFNNLAEYTSVMQKKDAASQKRLKPQRKESQSAGIVAHKAAAQARENVRKKKVQDSDNEPMSKTRALKQRLTNVFNRMEKYVGPMSVLSRCAKERQKVFVITRGPVAVRGHCKGYLIAFDKHFNMALMDVDEVYLKPVKDVTRENLLTQMRKLSTGSEEGKQEMTSHPAACIPKSSEGISREGRQLKRVRDSHARSSSDQSKHSQHSSNHPVRSSSDTDLSSLHHVSYDLKKEIKPEVESAKFTSKHTSRGDKTFQDSSFSKTLCEQKAGARSSSQNLVSYHSKFDSVKSKGGLTVSDVEPSSSKSVQNIHSSFKPCPMSEYKRIAESRSYTRYRIVERHVNQVFLRGDNVVSVSVVPV